MAMFYKARSVYNVSKCLISNSASKVAVAELRSKLCTTAGNDEIKSVPDQRQRYLNRMLYRSKQRGFLELDLILGKWAQDNIQVLDDKQLLHLAEILEVENPDLWKWLTAQDEVPSKLSSNPIFQAIQGQVLSNLAAHSSLKTRAKPGEPWVRGWDDYRKVGGPQAGNQ